MVSGEITLRGTRQILHYLCQTHVPANWVSVDSPAVGQALTSIDRLLHPLEQVITLLLLRREATPQNVFRLLAHEQLLEELTQLNEFVSTRQFLASPANSLHHPSDDDQQDLNNNGGYSTPKRKNDSDVSELEDMLSLEMEMPLGDCDPVGALGSGTRLNEALNLNGHVFFLPSHITKAAEEAKKRLEPPSSSPLPLSIETSSLEAGVAVSAVCPSIADIHALGGLLRLNLLKHLEMQHQFPHLCAYIARVLRLLFTTTNNNPVSTRVNALYRVLGDFGIHADTPPQCAFNERHRLVRACGRLRLGLPVLGPTTRALFAAKQSCEFIQRFNDSLHEVAPLGRTEKSTHGRDLVKYDVGLAEAKACFAASTCILDAPLNEVLTCVQRHNILQRLDDSFEASLLTPAGPKAVMTLLHVTTRITKHSGSMKFGSSRNNNSKEKAEQTSSISTINHGIARTAPFDYLLAHHALTCADGSGVSGFSSFTDDGTVYLPPPVVQASRKHVRGFIHSGGFLVRPLTYHEQLLRQREHNENGFGELKEACHVLCVFHTSSPARVSSWVKTAFTDIPVVLLKGLQRQIEQNTLNNSGPIFAPPAPRPRVLTKAQRLMGSGSYSIKAFSAGSGGRDEIEGESDAGLLSLRRPSSRRIPHSPKSTGSRDNGGSMGDHTASSPPSSKGGLWKNISKKVISSLKE